VYVTYEGLFQCMTAIGTLGLFIVALLEYIRKRK